MNIKSRLQNLPELQALRFVFPLMLALPIMFFILNGYAWQPGTRVDSSKQMHNLTDAVKPGPGTIIVCVPGQKCYSYLEGAFVLYRTAPPAGPGPCKSQGTGVIAMDENGYLYLCSPPWWDIRTGQPSLKGVVSPMVWMRTQQPMVQTWVPDRPAGQPTAGSVTYTSPPQLLPVP